MALRGFFDGSGRNEPQHRAVTLAGLSAPEKVWPDFGRAWDEALHGLGLSLWRTSTMRKFIDRHCVL